MSNLPDVMPLPDGPWMRRLNEGHMIWLVKQGQYARVLFPWQPPEPGYVSGRLAMNLYDRVGDDLYAGPVEVWYVNSVGAGFDGKQLVLPCEGHLPEAFVEILTKKEREFNELKERVSKLEKWLAHLALQAGMGAPLGVLPVEAGVPNTPSAIEPHEMPGWLCEDIQKWAEEFEARGGDPDGLLNN